MRISDWSSDVCSSDLINQVDLADDAAERRPEHVMGDPVEPAGERGAGAAHHVGRCVHVVKDVPKDIGLAGMDEEWTAIAWGMTPGPILQVLARMQHKPPPW